MVHSEKKLSELLIFAFLTALPFGQLLVFPNSLLGLRAPAVGLDMIALALAGMFFFLKLKAPAFFPYLRTFLAAGLFSLFLAIPLFGFPKALVGGLYLVRLVAAAGMLGAIWNLTANNKQLKEKLFSAVIIASVFAAVFGWLQYVFYPDTRGLYEWGWDDHLYRLVGTFLDPGFTGIIFVFGLVVSIARYMEKKNKLDALAAGFLFVSLLFTYSRASYLALLAGLAYLFWVNKKLRLIIPAVLILLAGMYVLPKPFGEGVKLERSASIIARAGNYSETLALIGKSPVFGFGFNNLCLAKEKYVGDTHPSSHSCSGSDSSLLLILATTGIAGFFLFLTAGKEFLASVDAGPYGVALKAILAALVVHSFFTNSLFYPWVLGYVVILGGISLKR